MSDREFERALNDWLESGSDRTPPQAIDAVLLAAKTTPQERDLRVPWRTSPMSIQLRFAAVIAVLAIAGLAGMMIFRPGPGPGSNSSLSPSPSPTVAPSPSPTLASTLPPIDTSGWTRYTSPRYPLTISYPPDWTVEPGDHDWSLAADAAWPNSAAEHFVSANGSVGVAVWSAAVAPGTTLESWIAAYCPLNTQPCSGTSSRAVPVYAEKFDRHPGLLVPFENDSQAFFMNGDSVEADDNAADHDTVWVVAIWRGESDPSVLQYGGARRLLEAFALSMILGGDNPEASAPPPS